MMYIPRHFLERFRSAKQIMHVYLRGAKGLRPDRRSLPEIPEEELEAALKDFDMNSLAFDSNK